MKKILLLLCLCVSLLVSRAQTYGNEWINYAQPYYKITITTEGMYRIPYAVLNASIPGFSAINGSRLTMYNNGKNIPIYVSNSGLFSSTDYIEFYADINRGEMETQLFEDSSYQLTKYASLFTSKAAYYLTYNASSSNPRFTTTINDMTSLPPVENYYMSTVRQILSSSFSYGRAYNVSGSSFYNASFDMGEGPIGPDFLNTTSNVTVLTPNIYTSGPTTANVKGLVFSKSINNHHLIIDLNGGTNLMDSLKSGYNLFRFDKDVPISVLAASNVIATTAADLDNDRNAISNFEITYPKLFNFEGLSKYKFTLDAGVRKYIEISNFNNRSTNPVLFDLSNGQRMVGVLAGGLLKFSIPASSQAHSFYLRSDNAVDYTTIASLTPVNFVDLNSLSNQGDYIIVSDTSLYDDGLGNNWVEEYRKYRDAASSSTGAFYARTIDINQLYEQFGYGVYKSPLCFRNFTSYVMDRWTIKPKYLFLIGKGREYNDVRSSTAAYNQCLIPTFGNPGSDVMLTGTYADYTPRIPTGRLSTENPIEVKYYLDKVRQYESEQNTVGDPYQTIEKKEWQKEILHLGGGVELPEQLVYQSYLNSYKTIIEKDSFGAHVNSFFKTSGEPIDYAATAYLKARIDTGISLLTFFGHAAPGTFDLSIDEPENYSNVGKYPVIYSNGCYSGYLFNNAPGISERYVLVPQKGAIAFLSTTGLSLSSALNEYATSFYTNLSKTDYGKGIGKIIQHCVSDMRASAYIFNEMIAHELTLHGDPAIKLNCYGQPDYMITPSRVYFNPPVITASVDTFEVKIVVTNLGKAIVDTYAIDLTRILGDGSQTLYRKRVAATLFKDTITFRLPTLISGTAGLGINQFSLYVDADDEVTDELSETNNYILNGVSTNIQSEDILPIYPYEFAIVPKQNITFKASTVNPFASSRWYLYEIDTTELFNSPIKMQLRKFQSGGVVHFNPSITFADSTVYYWRVSQDSTSSTSSYAWHYSSFIFINNEYPGWNQSHYYQWLKDDYSNLYVDTTRTLKFVPDLKEIELNTGLWEGYGGPLDWHLIEWKINGAQQHAARMIGCGASYGLNIFVIDPATGLPWASIPNPGSNYNASYGSYHCSYHNWNQYAFTFRTTGIHPTLGIPWSEVISNFIDSIPDGFYIGVYSMDKPLYTSWDVTLKSKFFALGAISLIDLTSGVVDAPWVFFTQKGVSSYVPVEQHGLNWSSVVNQKIVINGLWNTGTFSSPDIGPASEWGSVHWRHFSLDVPNYDQESMELIGVDAAGYETSLFTTTALDTFINTISATAYPYIKLKYHTSDTTNRTPTQPDYWRVLYKKAPEAAINPSLFYSIDRDTLQQGNMLTIRCGVESIEDIDMDSLLIKYDLEDATRNANVSLARQDSLHGLDTMTFKYELNTFGSNLIGDNFLVVEINPANDQLEQYHFNNYALMKFHVDKDKVNPLLDVTFDGRHILNGDLVSARPEILISLKDESKFLALDDTSLLEINLKYPDGMLHRMNYDNFITTFIPADNSRLNVENKARVEIKPVLTTDGTYELIVTDKDRSGNKSHMKDYRISFEVINKSSITNVLNYPNPFTTSTRFVFTLTGYTLPTFFKIQILSQSGKVVKEISQDEIGPITIGRNLTEYAWDGRDSYGDPLGNGVYFYRVVTSINDEKIEHMETVADKFFKKGFGKMVMIR